jgi:hypothetical protein
MNGEEVALPNAITLDTIRKNANGSIAEHGTSFVDWLNDRKNRRAIPTAWKRQATCPSRTRTPRVGFGRSKASGR